MSTYTVQLNYPHATGPTICWRVWIVDLVSNGQSPEGDALGGHHVYVPELSAWSPDILRMVVHELSAYLPAHAAADASVRVVARHRRQGGRAPKGSTAPRPLLFDHRVKLCVEARGWQAFVTTHHNSERATETYFPPFPGKFSAPMQAHLLDLAARSPIPLADLAPEYSALSREHGFQPSRLNVQRGAENPEELARMARAKALRLLRRTLDQLGGAVDTLGDGL